MIVLVIMVSCAGRVTPGTLWCIPVRNLVYSSARPVISGRAPSSPAIDPRGVHPKQKQKQKQKKEREVAMTRYWQLRKKGNLTPFASLLADYMQRHGMYTYNELADHLGVHRNTLRAWFHQGYIPNREHLTEILSKLDDVSAEDYWRAVGLETPPRPRQKPLWERSHREEQAWEQHMRRIQSDPRLSPQAKQAALDLLRRISAGGSESEIERRILAEHVVESELTTPAIAVTDRGDGDGGTAPPQSQPPQQQQPSNPPHARRSASAPERAPR